MSFKSINQAHAAFAKLRSDPNSKWLAMHAGEPKVMPESVNQSHPTMPKDSPAGSPWVHLKVSKEKI